MARRLVLTMAAFALAACSADAPPAAPADPARDAAREAIADYARLLIVERKAEDAFETYYADLLIQHDPWIGDGGGGDEEYLEGRREDDPEEFSATDEYVSVTHTLMAEAGHVAVKSHVFTGPNDAGRVFVDIWRLEDGKFVEHWDIIEPIDPTHFCGLTQGRTRAEALALGETLSRPIYGHPDPSADPTESERVVLEYMRLGQEPGRLVEALETYLADDFVQHAGRIAKDKQGSIEYLAARAEARAKDNRTSHFARVIADGDMVLVHRRVTSDSDPRGTVFADLYRVRGGRVIEHWDVVQPIPAFSISGRSMTGGPDDPLEPGRYHGAPEEP